MPNVGVLWRRRHAYYNLVTCAETSPSTRAKAINECAVRMQAP